MTVPEIKTALAACETIEAVNALNLSGDERKGVKNALAARILQLNPVVDSNESGKEESADAPGAGVADAKEEEDAEEKDNSAENSTPEAKPSDAKTAGGKKGKGEKSSKKEEESIAEEKKIADFKKKIPFACRMTNIVDAAATYFGDDFASSTSNKKTGAVEITLKSKTVFEVRGV